MLITLVFPSVDFPCVTCFKYLCVPCVVFPCVPGVDYPCIYMCYLAFPGVDYSADYHCVKKCKNKADGDYQSCKGCHVYLSCSNEVIYDERPCPTDELWDDKYKDCLPTSATCYG